MQLNPVVDPDDMKAAFRPFVAAVAQTVGPQLGTRAGYFASLRAVYAGGLNGPDDITGHEEDFAFELAAQFMGEICRAIGIEEDHAAGLSMSAEERQKVRAVEQDLAREHLFRDAFLTHLAVLRPVRFMSGEIWDLRPRLAVMLNENQGRSPEGE